MLLPIASVQAAATAPATRKLPGERVVQEYDFRRPNAQPLQLSAAEYKLASGGSSGVAAGVTPAHAFAFDGGAGESEFDAIAGAVSLTPSGALLRNQRAVGLLRGAGPSWRPCAEWTLGASNGTHFACSSVTVADPGTHGSFALDLIFRVTRSGGTSFVLSKIGFAGGGWYLQLNGGAGLQFVADDGLGVVRTITIGAVNLQEEWHRVVIVYDAVASELQAHGDWVSTPAPVAFAGLGSISNGEPLRLGGVGPSAASVAPIQLAYLAILHGTNASGFTATHAANLWKLKGAPAGTTYTRTGGAAWPVSDDAARGLDVVCYDPTQPAWKRATNWGGVAIATHASSTNLLEHAYVDQWTLDANLTRTATFADAPSGTRTACRLVSSATNVRVKRVYASTAGTFYVGAIYARSRSGTVSAQLEFLDAAGTVVRDFTGITLTTQWQRHSFAFVSGNTEAGFFSLKILASGADVEAWAGQVRGITTAQPPTPGPLVLTTGVTATCGQPSITQAPTGGPIGATGAKVGGLYCEFEVDADLSGVDQVAVSCHGGNDKRSIRVSTTERVQGRLADSGGAFVTNGESPASLLVAQRRHAWRQQWSRDSTLPAESVHGELMDEVDGVEYAGIGGGSFTSAETITTIAFGADHAAANPLEGAVRFVRTFADCA